MSERKSFLSVAVSLMLSASAFAGTNELSYRDTINGGMIEVGTALEFANQTPRVLIAVVTHGKEIADSEFGDSSIRILELTAQLGLTQGPSGETQVSFVDFELKPYVSHHYEGSIVDAQTGEVLRKGPMDISLIAVPVQVKRDIVAGLDGMVSLHLMGLNLQMAELGPVFLQAAGNMLGILGAQLQTNPFGRDVSGYGVSLADFDIAFGLQHVFNQTLRIRAEVGGELGMNVLNTGPFPAMDLYTRATVALWDKYQAIAQAGMRAFGPGDAGTVRYLRFGVGGSF